MKLGGMNTKIIKPLVMIVLFLVLSSIFGFFGLERTDAMAIDEGLGTQIESSQEFSIGSFSLLRGAVDDFRNTEFILGTNLSSDIDDLYVGSKLKFTSGKLLGESRYISKYDGINKIINFDIQFSEPPQFLDKFSIVKDDTSLEIMKGNSEAVQESISEIKINAIKEGISRVSNKLDSIDIVLRNVNYSERDLFLVQSEIENELQKIEMLFNEIGVQNINNISWNDALIDSGEGLNRKKIIQRNAKLHGALDVLYESLNEEFSTPVLKSFMDPVDLSTWYVIFNPTSVDTEISFTGFLPKEIKLENIKSSSGLNLYDSAENEKLVVKGDIKMRAKSLVVRRVENENVWRISEEEIQKLKNEATILLNELNESSFYTEGILINGSLNLSLDLILFQQNNISLSAYDYVVDARMNKELFLSAITKMNDLQYLVLRTSEARQRQEISKILRVTFSSILLVSMTFIIALMILKVVQIEKESKKSKRWKFLVLFSSSGGRKIKQEVLVGVIIFSTMIISLSILVIVGQKQSAKIKFGETVLTLKQDVDGLNIGNSNSNSNSNSMTEGVLQNEIIPPIVDKGARVRVLQGEQSAIFYTEPSLIGGSLGIVIPDGEYRLLSKQGDWLEVDLGLKTNGWILADQVEIVEDLTTIENDKESRDNSIRKVLITNTPTGFLNVRENSTVLSSIIIKVLPGEIYDLIKENNGWYLIRIQGDKIGWVIGDYVSIIE